jgi:hypothetical protein
MRERGLKVTLVVVGLFFTALVYRWGSVLWERNEAAYAEIMMMSLYVTLGVFLLLASRNPAEHRSLIAFAAWSSLAHAATMALQAISDVSERVHLLFGVALFTIIGIVLMAFYPAKGEKSAARASVATS